MILIHDPLQEPAWDPKYGSSQGSYTGIFNRDVCWQFSKSPTWLSMYYFLYLKLSPLNSLTISTPKSTYYEFIYIIYFRNIQFQKCKIPNHTSVVTTYAGYTVKNICAFTIHYSTNCNVKLQSEYCRMKLQ